ncbi:MAG: FecR domain-containing protein [Rhodanobacter sp.]
MASNEDIERTAAAWLVRREDDWSDAEQAEFQAWLDASTAHRVAWIRLNTGWQRAARLKALGAGLPPERVPPPGAWPESHSNDDFAPAIPAPGRRARRTEVASGEHTRVRRPRWLPWSAAAALLLLLLTGWWKFGAIERASYATAVGEMRTITLTDGSTIQLGSNSRVAVAYSRRQRHLMLERGEVFFNVASQPDRPLRVQVLQRQVVAVGTRFSVRRDGESLRVAVTEGRVRLEDAARRHVMPATLLSAGAVAVADRDGVHVRHLSAREMTALLSWREGLLVFRSTPLADAVAEFNRYSVHKLIVDDPAIATIPVGGSFAWTNAEAFARVLEQGFGLHVERVRNEIHLRAK